ncbi:MAG: transposase [Bacteroidales bacterium]|nr:transposase [Bacteroidales bacterium]
MPSKKNITPLLPDRYFHIFNRGINREMIFQDNDDYDLFLSKYSYFVSDFVNTYAFCLLSNHFHFLIKIKNNELHDYGKKVSEELRKMFISYSQIFNKKYVRQGSLFTRPFKRIEITNQEYLKRLVFYIHFNPQKHGFSDNFKTYKYSSYKTFFSNEKSRVLVSEVLGWFNGDIVEFSEYHNYLHNEKVITRLSFEEDE